MGNCVKNKNFGTVKLIYKKRRIDQLNEKFKVAFLNETSLMLNIKKLEYEM